MANGKRLIDAVPFREWLLECYREEKGLTKAVLCAVMCRLKNEPTVDAVEVVRCKDCTHWCDIWVAPDGEHEHGHCYLEESDDVVVGRWDDDFCSYGERKDDARV